MRIDLKKRVGPNRKHPILRLGLGSKQLGPALTKDKPTLQVYPESKTLFVECQVDGGVQRQGASLRQCVVGSVRGAKGLKQCVLGGSLGLWECKKSETQPPPCRAWLGHTDQYGGFF